ncbi:MAG: 50S ribosomal protein L25 [Actinomycetota bacterium]|jgi:large subunit ribosomal protein L25|nr:50S ribosomal protein L25 [Actinomycetota bacterium]
MPEIVLEAEVGRTVGSRATRRLRASGRIPGIVYGHGTEPVPVSVAAKDLRIALSGESGSNTLLTLKAGEQSFLTLARDMQRHPVKGTVVHVDFQIVRRDEVIAAEVPITLVGEALEVHHGDGLVDQQLFNLPVRARPADIPAVIELDVSELTIGGALRVADLRLPAGVTTDLEDDVAVVTGQPPRVQTLETEGGGGEGAEAGAASAETDTAAAPAEG